MTNQLIGMSIGIVIVLIMVYLFQLPSQLRNRRERKRILGEFAARCEQIRIENECRLKELDDIYNHEEIYKRETDEN